jgi:hypothetical protein
MKQPADARAMNMYIALAKFNTQFIQCQVTIGFKALTDPLMMSV